ncbi:DUF933 domain-containing protein [Acaricomes phytoseiuli]|nr:DUF933 domain-containing protein [Acaricomes phytoseiuli]MCW1250181.1 DUF933 domain-containing protein [Acaricomes phytoseiuli]
MSSLVVRGLHESVNKQIAAYTKEPGRSVKVEAKSRGKLRMEVKDYLTHDGDVVKFRHG